MAVQSVQEFPLKRTSDRRFAVAFATCVACSEQDHVLLKLDLAMYVGRECEIVSLPLRDGE